MKQILFIIVLLFFLKPVLPVLEYVLNYEYIATVLCENKEKPELKCNGKCQLMKGLAKVSEEEKPLAQDKKQVVAESEVLFLQGLDTFDFYLFPIHNNKTVACLYSNLYSHLDSAFVFHPPIFFI